MCNVGNLSVIVADGLKVKLVGDVNRALLATVI